jgi:hypothetical protein
LGITNQSLWTDEAISAFFADHARLGHLDSFGGVSGITNMPIYHLLLTAWVDIFGDSEQSLRSLNLPFACLFIASIVFVCSHSASRLRYFVAALFCIYPLLIYYVNDARPYTALLGLSTAATVSFLTFIDKPSQFAAWTLFFFSLAAVGTHLFGALCPLSLFTCILLRSDIRRVVMSAWRKWIAPLVLSGAITAIAFTFYVAGGGIASKVQIASSNPEIPINRPSGWNNIAFVLYEWLGFSGLGPPRNDMRVHSSLPTFLPYGGWIAVGFLSCASLALLLLRSASSPAIRNARTLLESSGISLLLLFVAARIMHFGFLGRHVMSLIGVACCSITLMLLAPETKLTRLCGALLMCAWTISSARLLYLYSYGKDDLRTAVQMASNTHLPILWNVNITDPDPGYYNCGDPLHYASLWFAPPPLRSYDHWKLSTAVHRLQLGSSKDLNSQVMGLKSGRYVLVKGKPDLADPRGLWAKKISEWHPRLLNRLNGYDVLIVDVPQH